MAPLRDIGADGYPTDYLAARVRGRRAQLLATGRGGRPAGSVAGTSDEAIWDALLTEFDWLRRQMNPRMRAIFAPVFTLFGIKTLVLAVRSKAAERHAAVERLMQHELFADDLRDALVTAPDPGAAVAAIAGAFAPLLGDPRRLSAAYAEGGVKAFESRLMRDFLAGVVAARLHPAIRRFFEVFADLRNVTTLYKHLRWGIHDAAAFVPGGTLPVARLAEASSRGDHACLESCAGELLGSGAEVTAAGEASLESRLLSRLTERLHKAGRRGDECDLVLDYVWSVYVEARNRALRLHAGDVDAGTLGRELIA
jgi:vacuolar-type H+-ATPase subunit C/Vma6